MEENIKDQELNEMTDRYTRLLADFENFRRVTNESMKIHTTTATKVAVLAFLSVYDIAVHGLNNGEEAMSHICKEFEEACKKLGVEILGKVGEKFDVDIHNCVGWTYSKTTDKGNVNGVVAHGAKINGIVIRHADVMVERDVAQELRSRK